MTTGDDRTPRQLDLFSGAGEPPPPDIDPMQWAPADPARLSDRDLIAAIPCASQIDAPGLAREAARRLLPEAVPALAALCRRFAGFGLDREITEQSAALQALASFGGKPRRKQSPA